LVSNVPLHNQHCSSTALYSRGWTALVGLGLLYDVPRSQSGAPHSVGLLWTRDRPAAKTSTWQYTPLTRNRYLCSRWDSNQQSQEACGSRSTP